MSRLQTDVMVENLRDSKMLQFPDALAVVTELNNDHDQLNDHQRNEMIMSALFILGWHHEEFFEQYVEQEKINVVQEVQEAWKKIYNL